MDKDDIYSIKEYLCQILKMIEETQDRFEMTVTLNEINSKLDRMIEQTTDKPSHQSPRLSEGSQLQFLYLYRNIEQKIKADNERQLKQDIIEQQMKSDYDMKLKKGSDKYIDETIYSDIEGEPQSRLTYDEIQQMRRKQYYKDYKCQLDPSMIVLESDLIKEAKYKELQSKILNSKSIMDKKCQLDPSMVQLDQNTFKEIIHEYIKNDN
ncbi:MAG: hypothetical protein EZS28_047669 [Streblomastix strix]|uniref:Uncharacterized protein n=1 Tax=Streblomastix strix TaxID=222440 RepID=A0A5J4TED2_9EUKA|nr:MAG: hypothetical protein EZS28_047669 [Streblomastix strix]